MVVEEDVLPKLAPQFFCVRCANRCSLQKCDDVAALVFGSKIFLLFLQNILGSKSKFYSSGEFRCIYRMQERFFKFVDWLSSENVSGFYMYFNKGIGVCPKVKLPLKRKL